jgi:hypothetical protein
MKTITLKTKIIVGAILLAIAALFFGGWYFGHKRAQSVANANIAALNKEIVKYQIDLNNQKFYVTSVEQEIKSLSQSKADGDVANAELRKINIKKVQEISRLNLQLDTLINIPHTGKVDTVIINGEPHNVLYLPFTFGKKDEWLDLKGDISRDGLFSISTKMLADIKIITGTDKETKLPTITVTTNNPYLTFTSLNSVKLDNINPKRYGIGVFGGYGINLTGPIKAAPIIGIGVSYHLIEF